MSNLLEKASILLTPTAYDDGKILSVKPNKTFGSNLIDYDNITYGSGGWSLVNDKWVFDDATNGYLVVDDLDVEVGQKYQVTVNISISSGDANFRISSGNSQTLLFNYTDFADGETTFETTVTGVDGTIQRLFAATSLIDNPFTLNSISVNKITEADFDFTRNSSATRVNSQGLIEDVQTLSSNLVSNGDFSQEGSELITNGSFDSDSGWTLGTGWSIVNGNANSDGVSSNSNLVTTSSFYSGSTPVKMTINVTDYVSGGLKVYLSSTNFTEITANGNYTFYTTADRTDGKLYLKSINFIGSIDNVSVKEVGQDWTLATGWSIGDGLAIYDNSTTSTISQSFTWEVGKTYKLTFDVSDFSIDQRFDVYTGSTFIKNSTIDTDTSYTIYVSGDGGNMLRFRGFVKQSFSIDNISVIEITEDTNLPRIDYSPYSGAGSCGHWLFEPQSTNLITYSEDISQSSWVKQSAGVALSPVVTASYGISPDGGLNASRVIFNTGGGSSSNDFSQINDPVVVSIGNVTTSVYIKSNTASNYTMSLLNAFGSYTSILVTTEWQRFEVSVAAVSTSSSFRLRLRPTEGTSSVADVLVWGAQIEEQSFATSYIPTSGSTVTRLQDAAFGAGSSDLINSTEGVLYAEIASFISTDTSDPNRYITITNGTSNQRIALLFGGNTNQLRAIAYSNTQSINLSFTTSLTDAKQFNKLAIKYKSGDYAFFLNGVKIGGSTETNIFTANTLNDLSFDVGGGTQKFRGKVKCVAVYKEALTDAELTCLTTI